MTQKSSQLETIKTALLKREKVTSVTAFQRYYITRLSSIIERLRKRGWPVVTTREKKNGLASYSLPKHWKP